MIIIQIITWWLLIGLFGWIIGTISDMIFRKKVPIEPPLFPIIMGPVTAWIAVNCLIREIVFFIK